MDVPTAVMRLENLVETSEELATKKISLQVHMKILEHYVEHLEKLERTDEWSARMIEVRDIQKALEEEKVNLIMDQLKVETTTFWLQMAMYQVALDDVRLVMWKSMLKATQRKLARFQTHLDEELKAKQEANEAIHKLTLEGLEIPAELEMKVRNNFHDTQLKTYVKQELSIIPSLEKIIDRMERQMAAASSSTSTMARDNNTTSDDNAAAPIDTPRRRLSQGQLSLVRPNHHDMINHTNAAAPGQLTSSTSDFFRDGLSTPIAILLLVAFFLLKFKRGMFKQ